MIKKPIRERQVIRTSDGINHIFRMDIEWWERADWMVQECDESLQDMADFCVRFRKDFPGDDLGTLLAYYIHCFLRDYHHARQRLANDNRPEAERAAETK